MSHLAIVPASLLLAGFSLQASPVVIDNGTPLFDDNGNFIHAHGGGMLKVGNYFYWFGENRNFNGNDTSFAVSCYRSQDLKQWEFRNHVLRATSDPDLNFAKLELPKVIFNPATSRYVMWMHKELGSDYTQARAAVASCATVDGDYTYHGSFRPTLNGAVYTSRDCTLFLDDDGQGYFLSSANGNHDLNLYRLTPDFLALSNLVKVISPGLTREAPALFKRNGRYFILSSGMTGWTPNQGKYATATNLAGPWSQPANFGDSTTFHSQPAFVLPLQGTNGTSFLYIGDRWARAWGEYTSYSRYVFLPLQFPTDSTLTMDYADYLTVDVTTGYLAGGMGNSAIVDAFPSSGPTLLTAAPTGGVQILNRFSGKAATVSGTNPQAEGAALQQFSWAGSEAQTWGLEPQFDGSFLITNSSSARTVDLASQPPRDGTPLVQRAGSGAPSQSWLLQGTPGGAFQLASGQISALVDLSGPSREDGAALVLASASGELNQQWLLLPQDNFSFHRELRLPAASAAGQAAFSPFVVTAGGATPAGTSISVPGGKGHQSSPPTRGIANYTFSTESPSSRVCLYLLAHAADSSSDELYVKLDGGPWESLWLQQHPSDFLWHFWKETRLAAGTHTFSFGWGDTGIEIDQVLVQVADEQLRIVACGTEGEGAALRFWFSWPSTTGASYAILQATELPRGLWTTVAAGIPASPPQNTYFIPVSSGGGGFYRIRVE